MKAAFFMLAGCAVLSGCATRAPQAPQPIMMPVAAMPSPASRTTEGSRSLTNEVDLTKHYFLITGSVARPGFYPLRPNTSTLLGALWAADPSLASWQESQVEVYRENGAIEFYSFRKIAQTNDPAIFPNDHIHVPQKSALGR